jgi:hypothetical protein
VCFMWGSVARVICDACDVYVCVYLCD